MSGHGTGIGILSAAYYLPPASKSVEAIFADERIPDEPLAADVDFRRDIGIRQVHLAGEERPRDLGLRAARQAVEEAGVDPGEIGLVLDFTSIPEDYPAPTWSAAGYVQARLGARNALATAVNTGGCASYHVALKTACALMRARDDLDHALLFSGDKTPPLNKTYYPITVTCDGGGAVVLKKGHDRRAILAVEVATVGKLHDVWYVPGLARCPQASGCSALHMQSDMKRFNESVIPINLFMFRKVIKAATKRAGVRPDQIATYIYPTFSSWDQRSFSEGLRIPRERIYTESLERHGHLQENDMVANYVDAEAQGRLAEGDLVMVTTNGAGFVWGAALIRH